MTTVVPWPTAEPSGDEAEPAEAPGAPDGEERSDDWALGDLAAEVEAGFAELESLAPGEVRRFVAEYEAEHAVPMATATIAITSAFLHAGAEAADRAELARFLPRVLRQTIAATLAGGSPPEDVGKPRLHVDRVFTLKGIGLAECLHRERE